MPITIEQVKSLCAYWERCPPPHVSLAILMRVQTDWKPKEKPKPFKESTPEEIAQFAAALGGGARVVRRPN